jgi:anti-anti-sigma factor
MHFDLMESLCPLLTQPTCPTRRSCQTPSGLTNHGTGHPARLTIRLLTPSVAAITAHGEIDASNASDLAACALGLTGHCRGLVLDLGGLGFFGTEGLSALQTIDRWAPAGLRWAVVPSAEVSRLMRMGDPDRSLPTAATVQSAAASVQPAASSTAARD